MTLAPELRDRLIVAGEQFSRTVRYTREQIAEFARQSGDSNPVHVDQQSAQRARHGEIIATGQQTAAVMMGLVASHFSRDDDGVARDMLSLNYNFAFKQPVFADQDLLIQWRVTSVEWNGRLGGMIGHLDGSAGVKGARPSVVGRGTVLVQARPAPAA